MNEHVDKIIDLRRYLVLTEGKMNADAQRAMTNIERQGNPWGLNRKERENWRDAVEDVTCPTVKEVKKQEKNLNIYFSLVPWVLMITAVKKLPYHLPILLNEAGVKVAILGNKEKNSGDTPSRLGNEFLFQELATAILKRLKSMM